ncbi:hypothetical protein [Pseudomonas putida]|uniref:hypothetical protein n=1 Tax=Pseudomonas putida TaxID=303 RepID=UPI00057950CF|nr:hypothetical protein [Pseudomonas putida]
MPRKTHLIVDSGCTQDNERWSLSACGLNEDSDVEWDGARDRESVTCKRCQAHMAKPRKAPDPFHKERPILFNGAMVRSILSGQKVVTRRPIKGRQIPSRRESDSPEHQWIAVVQDHPRWGFAVFGATEEECAAELAMYGGCPYGRCGDRLWVRETFALLGNEDGACIDWNDRIQKGDEREAARIYRASCDVGDYGLWQIPDRADWKPDTAGLQYEGAWRPSIHMPRWASRILLEITGVRVERLQSITPSQCIAEGAWREEDKELGRGQEAVEAFTDLWNSTGGDWDANPWVWVVEFKRIEP